MLLLLKKFLREAYRLLDERVAAFAGPCGTVAAFSRRAEEKASVSRVRRCRGPQQCTCAVVCACVRVM